MSGGELAGFASALLISRIVYSCSGLIVGYLSDRLTTPWGRRKPWIVVGTALEVASIVLLFMPPPHAGPAYFAWASALALFGFSMIDVPYIAWGSEMTRDYRIRSRITSYRGVFAYAGQLIFLALPLLPAFGGRSLLEASVIARLGETAIVLIVLTIALALLFGPPGSAAVTDEPARTSLPDLALHIVRNRPMWFLTGAIVFTLLANLMQQTLVLPFLGSVGLSAYFSPITIVGLIASIVSMPLWLSLTYRLGKHRFWTIALAITFLSLPTYFAVAHFWGTLAGFFAMTVVAYLPVAQMIASIPYSMMGDVIDYDEFRTRANHAANYSALVLLVIRLQTAVGGSIAFYVLAASDFNVRVVNPTVLQPGILVGYFVLPGLCLLAAMLCTAGYPIDARRQSIIRRCLERRNA